ncbi:serine protease Do [Thalassospira xiamenensis M-5 = DSM 17429]|uniref:Protease Do n=1 Tax=Thalassospira xiamenensis M-5 = DSM 17429 TaxID=1123366 RepID=A0AB72UFJ9_9PROT|nr:trypsin-like peptidase domain-containing protein [Thalassospira xiamenensis]AJD53101.1 protease Do [Thalassospira xiamenensis M-5 = DSM 17429]SIT28807.1 serine protease Do [Thalassospira xiamenensis M-5 = DSM 17429]
MKRTLTATLFAAMLATSSLVPVHAMAEQASMALSDKDLAEVYDAVSLGVVRINVIKKSYAEIVAEEREKKENGEDFYLPPNERGDQDEDEDRNDRDEKNKESEKGDEPKYDWQKKKRNASTGTGFFITDDGLIVTNEHVVRDGARFVVVLKDGRRVRADLVGKDFLTDLAVLRVEMPENVKPLSWGNSHAIRIGDPVFALGYPYGFDQSLTTGVISGKQRQLSKGEYNPYLQTDTAVNKGNSGGPLLSMDGKVVGVNSALYTRSGGNEGLAFSIPAEHAQGIIDLLVKDGEIKRGWFGIAYSEVKPGIGKLLGMDHDEGMLIHRAPDDEPAYQAGIRAGDVIVAVNGETVTSRLHFRMQAAEAKGETTVTVWRDGGFKSFTMIPGDMDEAKSRRRQAERDKILGKTPKDDGRKKVMGLELVPANEKAWEKLDLPVGTKGLVVDRMEKMGQGDQAGFTKGDFITRINDTEISTPEEFEAVMGQALESNAPYALVYFKRDGQDRTKIIDTLSMVDLEDY